MKRFEHRLSIGPALAQAARSLLVVAAVGGLLLTAGAAYGADTLTWDGTPGGGLPLDEGGGTWNDDDTDRWWDGAAYQPWSNGTVDAEGKAVSGSADSAEFGVGGTGDYTVSLGEAVTVSDIEFKAGADYTISGDILTIAGHDGTYDVTKVTVASGQTATISSVIASDRRMRFWKYGDGTLILTGDNTFSCNNISIMGGGVLNIRNSNALGIGGYAGTGSSGTLEVQDGISVSYALKFQGGGLQSRGGDNTWSGKLYTQSATMVGSFIGVDAGSTLTVSGVLDFDGSDLNKVGPGLLTLTSTNTTDSEVGLMTVEAGTLLVDGFLGSTGVTVESGATLGGSGTLDSGVTIDADGFLSPGGSIGTLTIGGDVTISGTYLAEINGYDWTSDLVDVGAHTFTAGGTLKVVETAGGPLELGAIFDLIDAGTINGTFAYDLPTLGSGLSWDKSDLYTTGEISIVPEPTTLVLLGMAGLVLLLVAGRRWHRRRNP